MSYEECEKHNIDATNGCPECERERDPIGLRARLRGILDAIEDGTAGCDVCEGFEITGLSKAEALNLVAWVSVIAQLGVGLIAMPHPEPFRVRTCVCGWERPLIAVTTAEDTQPKEALRVRYDCPVCGEAYVSRERTAAEALQSTRAAKLASSTPHDDGTPIAGAGCEGEEPSARELLEALEASTVRIVAAIGAKRELEAAPTLAPPAPADRDRVFTLCMQMRALHDQIGDDSRGASWELTCEQIFAELAQATFNRTWRKP